MDRGVWPATVHGVERVRHDLVTRPPSTATSPYIGCFPSVVISCLPFFWYCLYFQNCIVDKVYIKPRTELKYSSSSFPLLLCFNFKYNIEGKKNLFLFKIIN